MVETRYVALVPLRGGSKSIPLKNIKNFGGKPLAFWCLDAALNSEIFADVFVSTDSTEIKNTLQPLLPAVHFIDRPAEFATDKATSDSVLADFAEKFPNYDVYALIQATSPLTRKEDFIGAKNFLESHPEFDSLATATTTKRFFWSHDFKPINYNPRHRPMRQDFPGVLQENGAFYFTRKAVLQKYKNRVGDKPCVYVMSKDNEIELDEPDDWQILEHLHHQRPDRT